MRSLATSTAAIVPGKSGNDPAGPSIPIPQTQPPPYLGRNCRRGCILFRPLLIMKKLTYLEPISFGWFNAVTTALVGTITAFLTILAMLVVSNSFMIVTPSFLAYTALRVLLTSIVAFMGSAITAMLYNVLLKDKTPIVGFVEEPVTIAVSNLRSRHDAFAVDAILNFKEIESEAVGACFALATTTFGLWNKTLSRFRRA